jgi:photosystem II stability/assembly factor-like uncharacterized protein
MDRKQQFAGLALTAAILFAARPPRVAAQGAGEQYIWKNAIIRGGGFVSGVVFSPAKKDLVYVRTDVGGAYRSDDGGEHWIPITDSIGRKDSNFTGIESLALDPSDPSKVYMATGMYISSWAGPGAMMRSSDQGRTWQRTMMPFKMGGNEYGRNCGEKLAVDPNQGSILYFGSRKAGLWKSTDSGATWTVVESFPFKEADGPWGPLGISFVAFDRASGTKGSATPSIYVGVAKAGASLYRSDDAGATWRLVPGAPKDMFPSHAVENTAAGEFYFSFINNIGPNDITDGAIERYTVKTGKWQDMSPVTPGTGDVGKFGFGGLAIDAQHPEMMMVTTIDHWWPHDNIFRTADGGKHWKEIFADAVYTAPNAPWTYSHESKTGGTGWMGDIEIDPFDSAKAIYTTGGGIWGTADVTQADKGKPTHWGFPDENLEETVPITLISPPEGAHLLSGVGDIGGFRHEDLNQSPMGGSFANPTFNNTDSLDYAALKPLLVVRVGRGDDKIIHGAYSNNGGGGWKPFATEPPTSKYGGGSVAISADGAVVIWTPEQGFAFWSADMGRTWTSCGGMGKGMIATADRVNPDKFYSFDPQTGKLYESFDKGKVFAERQAPVASHGDHAELGATPGLEGDLWVVAADSLYHSTDSGVTFSRLEGFKKAFSIGFGKAAPGQTYPAVYLNAERDKDEGIYRSDDGGKSWVRVSDDQHLFGWIGKITGDPRVYGRVYLATGGRGVVYGDLAAVPQSQTTSTGK